MTTADRLAVGPDRVGTGQSRPRAPRPAWLRLLGRPVPVALAVAAVLHLLWWWLIATSGGDIAAQDAWAEFARAHPGSAYNLAWYGGMHPVSYSVLSPYIMALIGVRTTMMLAGTLSAGLLALLLERSGRLARPMWPALYGALAFTGNAISGRVTFGLGVLFGLAVLAVLFAWPSAWSGPGRVRWLARGALAGTLAALATLSSPVAGLFLGLAAAALWLRGRRTAAYAVGIPPVVVVALSTWLFPFSGEQPMSWISVILPVATAVAVLLLVPAGWRTVRIGAAIYVLAILLTWLVSSPIGTNINRLGLLFGGVVLVAVAVRRRSRPSLAMRRFGRRVATVLLAMGIATCSIWQVAMATRDAVQSDPPAAWTFDLRPLLDQLAAHKTDLGRVEVVPTRSHREAAALAPYVNLARGWNRQVDAERNPLFYRDKPLTAEAYHHWLDRWAVRYVVLSAGPPDPAAVSEAALVAKGLTYLRKVWSSADWKLYEVRHPTPLVDPPAKVLRFTAAELTVLMPHPGTVLVRIPDSPWLSLVDGDGKPLPSPTEGPEGEPAACLSSLGHQRKLGPARVDWTILHAPAAGLYRIAAPYKLPRGTTCPEE